jgi:hypothetical protein
VNGLTSTTPDDHLWRQVVQKILDLSETPWLGPSIPLDGGSGEDWATREMPVAETGVRILYRHRHPDGLVDLKYLATELG